eukprot:gene4441-5034_t
MFEDSGGMRLCKAKSDLKNRLAKEASSRCSASSVTSIVLDGSAILWVVRWPVKGVIADFVMNFKNYIEKRLLEGSSNVPTEINNAVVIAKHDVATSHEEADNIIAQQAIMWAKERSGTVLVLADDTDVFIFLL